MVQEHNRPWVTPCKALSHSPLLRDADHALTCQHHDRENLFGHISRVLLEIVQIDSDQPTAVLCGARRDKKRDTGLEHAKPIP